MTDPRVETNDPTEPVATTAAPAAAPGSVGKGVLIGLLLQLILVPLAPLALGIAVVQLAYIVPAAIIFKRKGELATVKGLWIAASGVALLNVACWGVVIVSLSQADFR